MLDFPATTDGSDLDVLDPINWASPLNVGLVSRKIAIAPFNGGVKWFDLVNRSFDGTVTNATFPATSTSGWGGTSRPGGFGEMRFDGTNDTVATNAITLGTKYTAAVWAKKGSLGSDRIVLATGGGSPYYLFDFYQDTRIYFFTGGFASTNVNAFIPNQWCRYAVTVNEGTVQFYRDGLALQMLVAAAPNISMTVSQISGRNSSIFFDGPMDDIRMWTRVLSPAEIQAEYLDSLAGSPETLNWLTPPHGAIDDAGRLLSLRRRAAAA